LPCYLVSLLRQKKRVYDAHELFCEMDEIVTRPRVYKVWKAIEKLCVPQFSVGYTIGEFYANEFQKEYGVTYQVVRNATVLQPYVASLPTEKYILYQGAVNEGRSFETLIPAMQQVEAKMIVCGEGNFYTQAQSLAAECNVTSKIQFKGYIEPQFLKKYTQEAYIGITLFTDRGKSNYLSLANRFFDYMHAGVPQLCMKYPEYEKINDEFEVAILLEEPSVEKIVAALHSLYTDTALYNRLQANCLEARKVYCWQEQEKTLRTLYSTLLD
ncbi:MAG TPA: glycosyltransferase, partial [Chitinophagaceae bacterium]|nr:glycosyltransferase [Chitinophagaceae bacterium]